MAECAWDDVTIIRKKAPRAAQLKSTQAINSAQRRGLEIETSKKFNAGQNKQHQVDKNTAKLDRETEELHHNTVTGDVAKLIAQARQAKGFNQKDFATKINEKPQVVTEYENGKAIPSQAILAKMERILEVKLRGKEKGQPILPKKPAVPGK